MWFAYAFSGAFFKSLAGYYRKKAASIPSAVFAWINSLVYIALLTPIVLYLKLPIVEMIVQYPWLSLGIAASATFGLMLNVKALSKDELSFVAPLNGFIPVIALFGAWLFIGEIPGIYGIACVFLIFLGTYVMALDPARVHWYDPIRHLVTSRAAQLSFGVAILYALNTVLAKEFSNLGYDPISIVYVTDVVGIVMLSYIFLTKQRRSVLRAVREQPKTLFLSSLSSLFGSLLHNFAVAATFASYALAIRRFDSVFSVLMGWKWLRESNIRNKLIGASIITVGSVFLALLT